MGRYIATRTADGFTEEFDSRKDFCVKQNLHHSGNPDGISKCLVGVLKQYKGWTFVDTQETEETKAKREAKIASKVKVKVETPVEETPVEETQN